MILFSGSNWFQNIEYYKIFNQKINIFKDKKI